MDDTRCVTGMETLDAPPETIATEALLLKSDRDSLESQSDLGAAGAWSFRALVRGPEWDPSLFTSVLTECKKGGYSPKLYQTMTVRVSPGHTARAQPMLD